MTLDHKTSHHHAEADSFDEMFARARRQVEMEFHRRTAHAGEIRHRMNPPLEVEEALDPAQDWPWAEPIHTR